ncbi:signal peptidase II [soil metagenome]
MQTARGASLTDERDSRRSSLKLFVLAAVVVYAIDQLTKAIAVAKLDGDDSITVIPQVISLTLLRNAGAAFSMGTSMTALLSLLAVGIIVFVLMVARRLRDPIWAVALGLLLGGALGNLTDRVLREPSFLKGHVVDFIDYGGYFVGNVADIAITVAAVLIFLRSMRGIGLDGSRDKDKT